MRIDRSNDRVDLQKFAQAVDARDVIERDRCGDLQLVGKEGCVSCGGVGRSVFHLFVSGETVHWWKLTKSDLSFCRVAQDGDFEGILVLDRLPTEAEGKLIRKRLGLPKRRDPSAAAHLARFHFKGT